MSFYDCSIIMLLFCYLFCYMLYKSTSSLLIKHIFVEYKRQTLSYIILRTSQVINRLIFAQFFSLQSYLYLCNDLMLTHINVLHFLVSFRISAGQLFSNSCRKENTYNGICETANVKKWISELLERSRYNLSFC